MNTSATFRWPCAWRSFRMWLWPLFLSVRRRRQPNALGGALSDFWDDKAQEDLAVRRHQPSQQVATAKFSRRTPAGPPRLVPRTLRAGLARLPLGGRTEDAGVRELSDRPLPPPRKIWPACGAADGAETMACGRVLSLSPQSGPRRSRAAARGRIVDARNAP